GRKAAGAGRPPGPLVSLGPLKPVVGPIRIAIGRPVAVLVLARRIDDAGDVARSAEDELHWAGEDARRRIRRPPGRDVILKGRDEVARCANSCEVDGSTGQTQASAFD